MRRALLFSALLAALLALGGACDLTDPFPDADGGDLDGSGGSGGGEGDEDLGEPDPVDECARNDDCPAARPLCVIPPGTRTRACVECTDSSFCPDDRPICGTEQRCVSASEGACRESFDCPVETPECLLVSGDVGVCVECRADDECPRARPICATTGRCVTEGAFPGCVEDDECGPGRFCDAASNCQPR